MTVKKEKTGETLNVAIEGSVDIKTAPKLSEALAGEIDDVMEVIFDLKETEYFSSAGLRVILGVYQDLDDKDGSMVLKNVNDDLMEILEMTGFTDFLEIEN